MSVQGYIYGRNNPINYTDPSGHVAVCGTTVDDCQGGRGGAQGPLEPTPIIYAPEDAVDNIWAVTEFSLGILYEPADWAITGAYCLQGQCSPYILLGLLPFVPSNAGKYADEILDIIRRGFPQGFQSIDEFAAFTSAMADAFRQAGFSDVAFIFQGSSITGKSFTTGNAFDVGRISDFDIGVTGPGMLEKAKELGIPLRGGGTRTGPLNPSQLKALGLYELSMDLSETAGRPVNFMIYDSIDTAINRSPSFIAPGGK